VTIPSNLRRCADVYNRVSYEFTYRGIPIEQPPPTCATPSLSLSLSLSRDYEGTDDGL